MGTWSTGNFGNDTARDWVENVRSLSDVRKMLQHTTSAEDPLDADDAATALAGCELLAASIGRAPEDMPELPNLKGGKARAADLDTAKAVIDKIRRGSELAELWAEDDDTEWQAVLDGLLTRLDLSTDYAPVKKKQKAEPPDDFLGHCFLCYGMVTESDGLAFEFAYPGGGTGRVFPHRACIEEKVSEPGPYWNDDGTPMAPARRQILAHMGITDNA